MSKQCAITRRCLLKAALAVSSGAASANVPAENVQWAGVSIAGQWDSASTIMPAVHSLIANEAFRVRLNDRVVTALREAAATQSRFQYVTDGALSRQGSDALALTLAITGEFVTEVDQQNVDGMTFRELSVRLRGLVMMANVSMDPMRQRVVCSFPIRAVARQRVAAGSKTDALRAREMVSAMLMGGEFGPLSDFVARFRERVPGLAVRNKDEWITVAPLRVTREAAASAGLNARKVELAAAMASSVIESGISTASDIPIVPASADGAISELKLSFADRGGMAFRNPDPSYSLDVSVYALGSQTGQERGQQVTSYITRFVSGFQVEYASIDPDKRRTPEASLRLQKQTAITYTSLTARNFEMGDQYVALIIQFSEELSNNLIPANEKWLEQQKAGSETKTAREMADIIRTKLPRPARSA